MRPASIMRFARAWIVIDVHAACRERQRERERERERWGGGVGAGGVAGGGGDSEGGGDNLGRGGGGGDVGDSGEGGVDHHQDDLFQHAPSTGSSSRDNDDVEMAASGEASAQGTTQRGKKSRRNGEGRTWLKKKSARA